MGTKGKFKISSYIYQQLNGRYCNAGKGNDRHLDGSDGGGGIWEVLAERSTLHCGRIY